MLLDKHSDRDLCIVGKKIDKLDRQIINLFAQRNKYIKVLRENNQQYSVSNFKTVLQQRKNWALEAGLHPNLVNKVSQYLIDYYLTERSK